MVIWTIKLLSTVRRAVAGRKYPHQLAWAVAFGLLLGLVPHGNLLAVALLILVLSLKLNHAMAGLTTIAVTFTASWLDPYSHRLGEAVLTHPEVSKVAAGAWQLPLVPWTDLNNTVVMGSFLIGAAAVLPAFVLSYPIFRWLAPVVEPEPTESSETEAAANPVERPTHQIMVVDQGHRQLAGPHRPPRTIPVESMPKAADSPAETASPTEESDEGEGAVALNEVAVETRIDVIRMKDYRGTGDASSEAEDSTADSTAEQEPMDEALSYLLRQLRDSQQRKVA